LDPQQQLAQVSFLLNQVAKGGFSRVYNKLKIVLPNTQLKKYSLNYADKIVRFYKLQNSVVLYAYKTFLILELQINTLLVRTKLAPFLFLAHDLCYYLLVKINHKISKNPYQLVSLYDTISIPLSLYNIMYYSKNLAQAAP
jgi:hypothetical protein